MHIIGKESVFFQKEIKRSFILSVRPGTKGPTDQYQSMGQWLGTVESFTLIQQHIEMVDPLIGGRPALPLIHTS